MQATPTHAYTQKMQILYIPTWEICLTRFWFVIKYRKIKYETLYVYICILFYKISIQLQHIRQDSPI